MTTPSPDPRIEVLLTEIDQFQGQADEANTLLSELSTGLGEIKDALPEGGGGFDLIAFLTMFGTAITAAATIVLAVYAYKAWKASVRSLKASMGALDEMRNQSRISEDVAAQQIQDQEWGRQVEALAAYLSALSELQDTPPAQGPGISSEQAEARDLRWLTLSSQINIAGNIWRLLHHKNAQEANILETAEAAIILSHGELSSSSQEHGDWITSVHRCIKLFGEWQRADDKAEVSEKIAELIRDDFGPLVDKALEQEGSVAALLQSKTGS